MPDSLAPFRIGRCGVQPAFNTIERDGRMVRLEPKAMQVLQRLAASAGEVVTKAELLQAVWPDTFVTEDVLTKCISTLRRELGDDVRNPRIIQTVPKRGYCLIAPLERTAPPPAGPGPATSPPVATPVIRGTRLSRPAWRAAIAAAALLAVGAGVIWVRRSAGPPPRRVMLAVLPFENLSADPEQQYFSDGLTEELITQLGRLDPRHLGVIARTSAMLYAHAHKGIDAVGRELGVGYVVEGSVRRQAGRVRVSAQLIQVADQTHLWAADFDGDDGDALALQTTVAKAVAQRLGADLLPPASAPPSETIDPAARDSYLRGRYFLNQRTAESLPRAITQFEQALARDPNAGAVHAGLAVAYDMLGYWLIRRPSDVFPQAEAEARRAIEIDPASAEGHAALAFAELEYRWDFAAAGAEYRRALDLDPNSALVHQWYAQYLGLEGDLDAARAELATARALDPLSIEAGVLVAALDYISGRNDEARRELAVLLELDPRSDVVYGLLAAVERESGNPAAEVEALLQERSIQGADAATLARLRAAYAREGMRGYWREEVDELERLGRETYVAPIWLAMDYACLHDAGAALRWLEEAYRQRCGWLLELAGDPVWAPLRQDPRFVGLVRRVGAHPLT